ncbi:hypothetical protein M2459_002487 [Parabacteroides sp. PF5-5]|uniref:DUF6249 domain-containing protein n=1 Tax=unclassified Parabacteroides TaxID=2649774 RepID=UPI00247605FA|nr:MULTISPECIES: DUF6249 domain-containing protein [unclassified Parabacteroides]MDH6305757.1 hypothetical protein [Parabacteroides sp. PH5-39]MDH6316829.1 hypothetical protein [Parabacteroides sp. PF5-13]MDH6320470.1 hypothetical protein [Parabacteroides sp. PH5-13]MDH6324200.1 hypothetical protein [Parabacteroides sp. PH5-8]MDH6328015.1 hypothetical protein [Parabacteroides sp. PH5-41]
MMDFIMVPLIIGICVAGVYGLFELFARRKERMAIIEKIGDKIDASAFDGQVGPSRYFRNFSFSALKVGCLMAGIGLGLLTGFIINVSLGNTFHDDSWYRGEIAGTAYGASVLLFGGLGLILAFIIEMRMAKKS